MESADSSISLVGKGEILVIGRSRRSADSHNLTGTACGLGECEEGASGAVWGGGRAKPWLGIQAGGGIDAWLGVRSRGIASFEIDNRRAAEGTVPFEGDSGSKDGGKCGGGGRPPP